MRQIALPLSLLVLIMQPVAAHALPYELDFPDENPASAVTFRPADSAPRQALLVQIDRAAAALDWPDDVVAEPDSSEPGDEAEPAGPAITGVARVVGSVQPGHRARGASYGPFRVLDERHAAMVDATDSRSPAQFRAMLRDHPGIAMLEMIDCPGTEDDRANLELGRMIRAQAITTHVPGNGWVASGAVEVFLAGIHRSIEPGARFAVHSWEDDRGRGPRDYSPEAPENRAYISYYRSMGMSERDARAFYDMTNSAPFSRPRILSAAEMVRWAMLERDPAPAAPPQTRYAQSASFARH